ncbi:MAG: MerR family transcriptional regulator [candidate division Zixibacteria bacterium]|nr:MerR family transcriptional regulator [candidate division Zixibacteria bacterium]
MVSKQNTNDKLYYSISEVARMTGLESYVLRYWEKEFPTLNPKKSRGGNRTYTQKDIDIINRIKHLRTKEKLTIAGTRKRLTMRRKSEQKESVYQSARARTLIAQIRRDIEKALEEFS